MEKVASADSKRSERTPSLSRVYSAPHVDNQSAFYATSKGEDGQETDPVVPSYTAQDNQDLENGNSGGGSDPDGDLQPTQTSRSQRSELDSKLVCISFESLRKNKTIFCSVLTCLGQLERTQRPRESKELVNEKTLGGRIRRLVLHFHITSILIHGCARLDSHRERSKHSKRSRTGNDIVHICSSV